MPHCQTLSVKLEAANRKAKEDAEEALRAQHTKLDANAQALSTELRETREAADAAKAAAATKMHELDRCARLANGSLLRVQFNDACDYCD